MKVYLAGPEVFLANAVEAGRRKKAMCDGFGIEGLFPFDQRLDSVAPDALARTIFAANVAMIREANAVIANLTPFRGVAADAGTVLEVGLAFGLGKPVFGYSNDPRPLFARTAGGLARADLTVLDDGRTLHPDGMTIEDFGLADNLMIEEAIAASGGAFFTPEDSGVRDIADLALFETCLRALIVPRDSRRTASA